MEKIIKIFFITCISLFGLIILGIGITIAIYFSWEKNFSNNMASTNCLHGINTEGVNTEEKIKNFVLSYNKIESLTFSKEEVLSFLSTNIGENQNNLTLQDLCVDSKESLWKIYAKFKVGEITLPWVRFDFVKDNMETIELYISTISIGDTEVPESLIKDIKDQINKGISDAILMITENGFGGRTLQNIELKENEVIIKGISN